MAKVIVTGSINMDIVAIAARHPQPGETVLGSELHFYPGGKGANQAVAAARAGAEAALVADVGDDRFAAELMSFLTLAGVDPSAVRVVAGVSTGVALIVVDARGENSIVVVPGANARLAPADVVERLLVDRGDVVVAQLEVPIETVEVAFARARARHATTVLNPSPAQAMSRDLNDLVDVLVVNEIELSVITATEVEPTATVDRIRAAVANLGRTGNRATVVTLGARGAVACVGDRTIEVPGRAATAIDTTGAGDCFVGTLAARLAAGDSLEAGLELANVAASICVERPGAGPSMPTLAEARELLTDPEA